MGMVAKCRNGDFLAPPYVTHEAVGVRAPCGPYSCRKCSPCAAEQVLHTESGRNKNIFVRPPAEPSSVCCLHCHVRRLMAWRAAALPEGTCCGARD